MSRFGSGVDHKADQPEFVLSDVLALAPESGEIEVLEVVLFDATVSKTVREKLGDLLPLVGVLEENHQDESRTVAFLARLNVFSQCVRQFILVPAFHLSDSGSGPQAHGTFAKPEVSFALLRYNRKREVGSHKRLPSDVLLKMLYVGSIESGHTGHAILPVDCLRQ
jgi:hypothetical protein